MTELAAAGYDLGFQVYMRECAVCHGAADVGPSLTAMRDRDGRRWPAGGGYLRQSIVEPARSSLRLPGYHAQRLRRNMTPTRLTV